MFVTILLLQAEEALGTGKALVQDGHQRVEHFGANIEIHVFVVLVTHVLRGAACYVIVENVLGEELDFFLFADAVAVVHVLSFFVLVEALTLLRPVHLPRGRLRCLLLGRANRLVHGRQALIAFGLNHVLYVLDLDVALEGHVGEHYSDVFRCDEAVAVEVIP